MRFYQLPQAGAVHALTIGKVQNEKPFSRLQMIAYRLRQALGFAVDDRVAANIDDPYSAHFAFADFHLIPPLYHLIFPLRVLRPVSGRCAARSLPILRSLSHSSP